MGFFDKRSRQFRRKIKDMRSELKDAEKQGKYIKSHGLFFAELEDMGDATMMFFSAQDLASSEEENVIRNFFDRNGFTVEELKLTKGYTEIGEVEIIPPREMIMAVGRDLKAEGYRMIDDSENERMADLESQIYPLTAVVRMICVLFCDQVYNVIVTTHIKQNKEGNRLLKWIPKVRDHLSIKLTQAVIDAGRESFISSYQRFYGDPIDKEGNPIVEIVKPQSATERYLAARSRQMQDFADEPGEAPTATHAVPQPAPHRPVSTDPRLSPNITPPMRPASADAPTRAIPSYQVPPSIQRQPGGSVPTPPPPTISRMAQPTPSSNVAPILSRAPEPAPEPLPRPAGGPMPMLQPMLLTDLTSEVATGEDPKVLIKRRLLVAATVAQMYKEIVKASPSRCVRNSSRLLEMVNRLFQATATCLMVRTPHGDGMTIYAQAGKMLSWGEGGAEGYPVSQSIVAECIKRGTIATNEGGEFDASASMIMHHIEVVAAMPIHIEGEIQGVLYLDRRSGMLPFSPGEQESLVYIAQVFRDFPDLTLGLV